MTRKIRRSIRRRRLAVAAGLAVAIGVPVVQPSPQAAQAFPRLDGSYSIGVQTLTYRFASGWTGPDQDQARIGFNRWNGYRNRNNTVYIGTVESTLGIQVFRNINATSATSCSGGTPTSMTIGSEGADLSNTATHEAGHAHGLAHSGNDDSLANTLATQQPVMDGCFVATGVVRNDDRAQYSHEGDGGTYVPGVGFENGTTYNSGTYTRPTGSPY
jgi:hypothetical protein